MNNNDHSDATENIPTAEEVDESVILSPEKTVEVGPEAVPSSSDGSVNGDQVIKEMKKLSGEDVFIGGENVNGE